MGMARFGHTRFPQQYPATKTEWADPLPPSVNSTPNIVLLRPFLKNLNLETHGLKLTYDANCDGWDAASFHWAVDKKGSAVVGVMAVLELVGNHLEYHGGKE